jgi:hypothetical protein
LEREASTNVLCGRQKKIVLSKQTTTPPSQDTKTHPEHATQLTRSNKRIPLLELLNRIATKKTRKEKEKPYLNCQKKISL